jgi:sec-independent protein translocase protein TatA
MLNNIGPAGLLLIALVVLVLFGRGRVGALMGEVGDGLSSLRRGLREGGDVAAKQLEHRPERDPG